MSKLYKILWNPNIKAPVYHIVNTATGKLIAERGSHASAKAYIKKANSIDEVPLELQEKIQVGYYKHSVINRREYIMSNLLRAIELYQEESRKELQDKKDKQEAQDSQK